MFTRRIVEWSFSDKSVFNALDKSNFEDVHSRVRWRYAMTDIVGYSQQTCVLGEVTQKHDVIGLMNEPSVDRRWTLSLFPKNIRFQIGYGGITGISKSTASFGQ
jgi:hypothetical protein